VGMGLATPDHGSGGRREVDFFDVKGVVEQIASMFSAAPTFEPSSVTYLVEGRAAEVVVGGERIGVLGLLAPQVVEAREVPRGDLLYVAELSLDALAGAMPQQPLRVVTLPRHPSVVRDISILVDDTLSADAVRGTIRAVAPPALVSVREFDRYQGKGIAEGKVSLSLRLTFQAPDRTLTDEEVQAAMDALAAHLRLSLGAVQR
jgi:phenylalanyl-tRNA synthetase beta chain